ncbi:hypothetical protein [Smaragdicoccus niigatensis]|uniref:hypothetical protein n=1 Tax=Smaragdicoccus niigatensis TaxID=359359 RepID=UPI00035E8B08|nr:hypothetical protein [Smaragdicoccus niigatensis]
MWNRASEVIKRRTSGAFKTTALAAVMMVAWPQSAIAATAASPFAPTSPWNTAVPASPQIDPNSAAMIAYATRNNMVTSILYEYSQPIYVVDASTPRYTVTCTIKNWGTCPFQGKSVPIPVGAKPSTGSDGALITIDETAQKTYEFWQAKFSKGKWTASWGAVNDLGGSGWQGAATGAGASRLGGAVRVADIANGTIPHALQLVIDNACKTVFRAPATKTDGVSTRTDCIPEGARIQLDPTIDLSQYSMPAGVRVVARALQQYGGYVVDKGGAPLGVVFERAPDATSNFTGSVYNNAGFMWDYFGMTGFPLNKLRVLN